MRSVPIRFSASTVHTVVISPCLLRVASFVTFTISEEYTYYEDIFTADISSAYGRLECSAVLSLVGAKHTAHLFVLTALSLILFQCHFLERLTVGGFLNLK